ncbi:MAG: A/G-specific adenine glycosylase [Erysipelotrichaceae bacterium]
MNVRLISEAIGLWYQGNKRALPWRKTSDPYCVWVSEIMLQQTRVDTVIPYYLRFIKQLPSVEALAQCEQEELYKLWEGLGYYRRVSNMKAAAQQVMDDFNGQFPTTYEDLLSLKGIGEYTAGAIASIAYGLKTPAVDGNVCRVYTRLYEYPNDIKQAKTLKQIKEDMSLFYEYASASDLTQGFMELGATICKVSQPECESCPINAYCKAYQQETIHLYPYASKKKPSIVLHKTVYVLRYQNMVALNMRGEQGVLKGLYELVNVEGRQSQKEIVQWLKNRDLVYHHITLKKPMKHIFTHQTWMMKIVEVECEEMSPSFNWYSIQEIQDHLPLPTAFKKIFDKVI